MFDKINLRSKPFIIAEIGQNHQGDLDLARDYIKTFALSGADAVKFQTRDNKYLFSEGAYYAPYNSENAFDNVYGLHREKLELKKEWYPILIEDCKKYGVKFMCTPFDEPSLSFLINSGVEILKIASFDLGNIPFIHKIAQSGLPVVISIGGGKFDQIQSSVKELLKNLTTDKICILHCVSEYPCTADKLGLNNIENLQRAFPELTIGLSDHFNGILSGPIGFMKGACVFEKHVTLNRSWKGTDHSFALEPDGFKKFVRDIHRVNQMMEPKAASEIGNESVFKKLGKSIVASRDISAGEILTVENLSGKIFEQQFIPVRESNKILGRTIKMNISVGNPITFDNIL